MARIGLLPFLLQLLFSCAQGQSANRLGHCDSPAFDRKVGGMLRFDVPAVDVDSVRNSPGRYLLLDARAEREYQVSHLPGARWADYPGPRREALAGVSLNQPIVVYCSIGYRSEHVARNLREQGYTNVSNLYGSIFEWANRGYPLEDGAGRPVKRVHGYNASWSQWVTNRAYERVID